MKAAIVQKPQGTEELAPASGRDGGSVLGAAAIFLLSMACYLPLLGSAPLAGTEGHRVFPALGMVQSGDWLLPRLFGQLYLIKPPLHDWLIALAQILSAHHGNEMVWRLPSAIGGALLNMALYLFGARWFGRMGGIVSGLCGLGLLCLWGQARTADVDGTNTFACSLAALCLVELFFGRPKRRWAWRFGAGLALGATLMSKGPAGLPLIVAVIIWALCSTVSSELPRSAVSRWLDLSIPPLLGLALFGAYGIAAKIALDRLHLPPDYSGFAEVGNKFYPASLDQLWHALLVPSELFAFTLPVSVALPLVFAPRFRAAIAASESDTDMPRDRLTRAMGASVLISWGICLATGMVNPRYGYVTVAPLCLLAGAVAASLPWQVPEARTVFHALVLGSVIVLFGGCVALTVLSWRGGVGHFVMVVSLAVAMLVAVISYINIASGPNYRGTWGLVALLMLAVVPFAYQFRLDRFDRSGYGQAAPLREYVGGPDAPILTGAVARSLPELFWYAGLYPRATPTFSLQNPRQYRGGFWVVMLPEEYHRWSIFAPQRLSRVRKFVSHKDLVYVAWFEREKSSPSSTPATPHPPGG